MSRPIQSIKYKDTTFKVGDLVTLLKTTYGSIIPERVGQITQVIDDNTVYIDFASGISNWLAHVTDLEPIAQEDIQQIEIDQKIKRLAQNIIKATDIDINAIRTKIQSVNTLVQSLQRQITDAYREVSVLEKVYKSRKASISNVTVKENIAYAVRCLLRDNRYENIDVTSAGNIVAYTTEIKIAPKVYDDFPQIRTITNLGKYIVTISPARIIIEGGRLKVMNYIHPHITDSTPCFGTFTDTIAYQHSQLDIVALLRTIWDYLTALDEHGWYKPIHAWLADVKDRCGSCYYLIDECRCNKCESCGHHTDDCECSRCPNSDEIVDDYNAYCIGDGSTDERCRHARTDDEGNYERCGY